MKNNADFLQITGKVKVIPTKPPKDPVVKSSATQYQISQANWNHMGAERAYKTHLLVEDTLKKLITKNIDEIYLSNIEVQASTVLQIIDFLKKQYYKITPGQIASNNKRLRTKWDPMEHTIKAFFDCCKKCVELTKDAVDAETITDKGLMTIMMVSFAGISKFCQDNHEWTRKDAADKKLGHFKAHYVAVYEELLPEQTAAAEEITANNAITTEIIKAMLQAKGLNEESTGHVNKASDSKLCELISKLTEKWRRWRRRSRIKTRSGLPVGHPGDK